MRYGAQLEKWMSAAFAEHAHGDKITYDFTFMPGARNPDGSNQPPGYFIAAAMPTGLTDVMCVSMASIPNGLVVTHEQIVNMAKGLIEGLREQRTQILATEPERFDPDQFSQPPTTDGNGSGRLYIPGNGGG
jgi:hypothetical protein